METSALRSSNNTFILPKSFLGIARSSASSHAPSVLFPFCYPFESLP
jgi:hypothetical protein